MKKVCGLLILLSLIGVPAGAVVHEISGNIEHDVISCKKNVANNSKKQEWKIINRSEVALNNDFKWDNVSLMTSVGYLKTDDVMYNNISKGPIYKLNIVFINDLYLTYRAGEYTVYGGLFSFRKGTLYEYGFNDYRAGNGIYSVITNELQGILIKKQLDKHTSLLVGSLYSDTYVNSTIMNRSDRRVPVDAFKGTTVGIASLKYVNGNKMHQVDVYHTKRVLLKAEIGKTTVLSYAWSYNAEATTGMLYYGLVSGSYSYGNNIGLSPIGFAIDTPSAYFGDYSGYGWKYMLGVRKTLDIESIQREVVLGGEYGHIYAGYVNLSTGKPLEPYSYSLLGDTWNAYAGIRYNRYSMLKLRYCVYDNNGIQYKSGMSTVTGNTEDMPSGSRRLNSLTLQFYINF